MTTQLLRVPEAAERLAVHPKTVWREIRAGHLRAIKVRSEWRVPADAIDEYIEQAESNQDHLEQVAS